jgi:hypothetical protein
MSEKLDKLWEVLEKSSSRMKLEEAMKQAGYSPAEIQELEDGDPEIGSWLKVTFNDLKKSSRRDRLFKSFVHSDRFQHLMLLRHKASHYALDALFCQFKIDWRAAEELNKK